MSVAEMKIMAINHLLKLESENAVQEILLHLEKLAIQESESRAGEINSIFNEAVAQYGDVLKKLAE